MAPNHDGVDATVRELLAVSDKWLDAAEVCQNCECPRCLLTRRICGSMASVYAAAGEALRGNTGPIEAIAIVCRLVAEIECRRDGK